MLSDHYDGKSFFNPGEGSAKNISLLNLIKWKVFDRGESWPTYIENKVKPTLPRSVQEGEVFITLINHATELIQLADLNLLTDPIFSNRASPFSWIGPKRVRAPALTISELPKIDIILLSHNHYDHMDIASLKAIEAKDKPLFIVPLGNAALLKKKEIASVIELDWWDEYPLGEKKRILMTPAKHWSGRGLFDRRRSLWASYLIFGDDLTIFFAGDSGYADHFKEIQNRCGTIHVALLPIGACQPRWFMQESHMDPSEAMQAFLDLKSDLGLGMHYDTFPLANESISTCLDMLNASIKQLPLSKMKSFEPQISGKTIRYTKRSPIIPSNLREYFK